MHDNVSPLLKRERSEPIATISASLAAIGCTRGVVTVEQFLGHVHCLADQLPEAQFAVNLCDNRYCFLVTFCAALVRKQINLLPANKANGTLANLKVRYPKSYILHDGPDTREPGTLNINTLSLENASRTDIPLVDKQQCAAIVFTSGSTGSPTPIEKTWHTLFESTEINARNMIGEFRQTGFVVATVPGQHMWGMETSILLPLMRSLCISDARPFFPQDIVNSLAQGDAPRILVTTPVHLRAMLLSGLTFPKVALILCATAHLSAEMAREAESLFGGKLKEIYGCSEAGSLASRYTTNTADWLIFEPFDLLKCGQRTIAKARHLPVDAVLQDNIDMLTPRRFVLRGRSREMLKIAGKRTSIQELNNVLLTCQNVLDGVIYIPTPKGNKNVFEDGRPVAIVVFNKGEDEEGTKQNIIAHFHNNLDPVFSPRSIYVVASLPREANGKLIKRNLDQLYWSLTT